MLSRDTIAFGRVAHLVAAPPIFGLTDTINRRQVERLRGIVAEMIPPAGTAAILGLSYKPHTPVVEEPQGIMLAKALKDAGYSVIAHDPMASVPANGLAITCV